MEKLLRAGFAALGLPLDETALTRFETYYELLEERSKVMNLTATCKKVRRLCHRHYTECGRPFAEPYSENYACKQRVFDYAQSGVNRQN